ncbi:MAG: hypothetical protein M3220_00895 [Chloroflexota bacterium]|nr:hypothetical protein [Chloroflexota bacterium]
MTLSDGGGSLTLLTPEREVVEVDTYPLLQQDASYNRDANGAWHSDWEPSPGMPNLPPRVGLQSGAIAE